MITASFRSVRVLLIRIAISVVTQYANLFQSIQKQLCGGGGGGEEALGSILCAIESIRISVCFKSG